MTRIAFFATALIGAIAVATPALAQQQAAPCVKRSDFLKHLATNYDEAPVAMGVTASGRVLEVVVSERGTWTIIVTMPNGVACGIASGDNWETVLAPVAKGPGA